MNSQALTRTEDELDMGIELSDFMMMVMMAVLMQFVATVAAPVAQGLQAQAYQGRSDSRTHPASGTLSWLDFIHDYPHTPWISAFLINDGPDAVEVGINYPNDRFIMNPNETRTVIRSGAKERIAIIFFKCAEGETASVRVEGEY